MNYERVWKALSDLAVELKKRGRPIQPHVVRNLRSAKTMIQILKADPSCVECVSRIEGYLEDVEFTLMLEAQELLGAEFVERWMKKLEEARKAPKAAEVEAVRFVPGAPRGMSWVRVQTSNETPIEIVRDVAEECGLSYKVQESDYVLVFGDKGRIESFLRKVAERVRGRLQKA